MGNDAAWKDEYLVGEDSIDNQHKELIAICRTIEELADSGQPVSKEDVNSHLTHLFEEFRNHFDEEMQLYRRVYRLAYVEHEQHHADFLEKLADVMDQAKQGAPDLKALITFARHWFIKHIVFYDIPQFEEIRARGFKKEEWGLWRGASSQNLTAASGTPGQSLRWSVSISTALAAPADPYRKPHRD